ncbi:hypothetical protein AX16_001676 [Volvariella volvacea WC 439]|nr:hypothetical protein AX16_001676 [Volvariella volvacea WC 439]
METRSSYAGTFPASVRRGWRATPTSCTQLFIMVVRNCPVQHAHIPPQWQRLNWTTFHSAWWGVPLSSTSGSVSGSTSELAGSDRSWKLKVPEPATDLLNAMGHLEADTILVRSEYISMYERAVKYFELRRGGIVICGSPGIGKSLCLIYFLRRRMASQLPTLLTVGVTTYLFTPLGVFALLTSQVTELDIHIPSLGPEIWSLVDTRNGVQEQPHWSLVSGCSLLRPVQAACTDGATYEGWRWTRGAVRWYMQPWTREEIEHALPLQFGYSEKRRDEIHRKLDEVVDVYGSHSARTVFRCLLYATSSTDTYMAHALLNLEPQTIKTILRDTDTSDNHALFTIIRLASHPTDDDTASIVFASPFVAHEVRRLLGVLELRDAQDLMRLYHISPESARSGLFGHWVVESYVHRVLCGHAEYSRVDSRSRCVEMDQVGPASFAYEPTRSEDGCIVMDAPEDEDEDEDMGRNDVDLGLRWIVDEREIRCYESVEDIELDGRYYVPRGRVQSRSTDRITAHSSLLDGFFFDTCTAGRGRSRLDITIIRVVQAGSENRAAGAAGCDDVAALWGIDKTTWDVHTRCVLVVPTTHDQVRSRIVWDLPDGWRDERLQGRVFALFLPVYTRYR